MKKEKTANIEKEVKTNSKKTKKKKTKRVFSHFTHNERLKIEAWQKAKVPADEMAKMLNKNSSSVYRELKRGKYKRQNTDLTFTEAYSPAIAEEKYNDETNRVKYFQLNKLT